jgi:hypothetical protein
VKILEEYSFDLLNEPELQRLKESLHMQKSPPENNSQKEIVHSNKSLNDQSVISLKDSSQQPPQQKV